MSYLQSEADLLHENAELKEAMRRNGLRIDEDGYLEYRDKERDDALEKRIRELTASNFRLREALVAADSAMEYMGNKANDMDIVEDEDLAATEGAFELVHTVITETPAANLEAITAPLVAKHEEAITKLIDERDEAVNAFDDLVTSLNVQTEYSNLRGYSEILADCKASLAAIQAEARAEERKFWEDEIHAYKETIAALEAGIVPPPELRAGGGAQ